jgi:hypothetical protein
MAVLFVLIGGILAFRGLEVWASMATGREFS